MRLADSDPSGSQRFAGRTRPAHFCAGIVLACFCAIAQAGATTPTLKHQATGTVESHTPTQIVMLHAVGKNKTQWDFVLTSATQIPPGVAKGVRVTIYYHDDNGKRIADRIKVIAVTPPKKTN